MIVSCMEKIFSLFFQHSPIKTYGCVQLYRRCFFNLQHYIQVMYQLNNLVNLLLLQVWST